MPLSPTFRHVGHLAVAGVLLLGMLVVTAARAHPVSAELMPAGAQSQALAAVLEPRRAAQIRRIIADPDESCLAAGARPGAAAPQIAIQRAAAALELSPVGAWLLGEAAARQVLICFDPATELAAYYRAELRLIGVQAELEPAAKTVFLAHELAHVLQHPRYSNNRNFPVEDLILMHRMREATAEAVATRVLWQLRAGGRPEPWQAKLATGYRDIARTFAEAMAGAAEGAVAGRELRATRAAFERWFAWPARLQQYDDHMLDHIERIARDDVGLIPPRLTLTDDFLRGIGWHAGESFLAGADRPLTDASYRAGLSAESAARLAAVLGAGADRPTSDAAWQDGAGLERPDR